MTWTVDVLSRVDFIGIPSLLITTTPSTLCMIVNMMTMTMMMVIMKVMCSCLHLRICANSFQDLFNLIHDINIKCDLIVILIVILLYSCGILMMAINKMKLLRIRHAHVWLGLMMLIIQFCLRSERNWPTRLLLSLPHPEFWLMIETGLMPMVDVIRFLGEEKDPKVIKMIGGIMWISIIITLLSIKAPF